MSAPRRIAALVPLRIAALVLAAGSSRRMGRNKLLLPWRGHPLVRHAAAAALDGGADPVIVVLGHEAALVAAALDGLPVHPVIADAHAAGMSASLKAGLVAVPPEADGLLVCLGDMPLVDSALVARLIAAFHAGQGREIIQPAHVGRRGNPVLWPRRFLPEMMTLDGDQGARALLARHAAMVREVAADGAIHLDVDTPEALADLTGRDRM